MATKNLEFKIGYSVDKASLQVLQKSLAEITANSKNTSEEFLRAKAAASQLQDVLEKSYNSKLDTINVSKFNKELASSRVNVEFLKEHFRGAGNAGATAFNALQSQILGTNIELKKTSKLMDDMATSFKNTVKWGISSAAFNNMTSSLQKAYDFAKGLDRSLNDIRIVTGKSAKEMELFAKSANDAAKGLGSSTRDFTEASLIYYQQGLDTEAPVLAETTLKTANVTGQSTQEVSEQLTAVWNGYKVANEAATQGMQVYERYVDKLAAVAASTATDLEELATGMSKVASAANLMGVDIDQLNAQMATIVSVTRQAPESVGTALKTIYARMGDIEAGLDSETTLGSYTAEMKKLGFNVLDADGKLKDMGNVIEDIGSK